MPLETISISNLDQDTDSPRLARQQLLQLVENYNTLISNVTIIFLNDPIVVPANTAGVLDFTNASTDVKISRYGVDETGLWGLSKVDTDLVSMVVGYNVSIISMSSDTASVVVTASRPGFASVSRKLLVTRNKSAAVTAIPDTTPPPTPTGFSAAAGINVVQLSWTAASYSAGRGNGQTNIYGAIWDTGSAEPTFADVRTKLLGSADGTATYYSFPSEPNVRWTFWIKFKSKDGYESAIPAGAGGLADAVHGYQALTGQDPTKILAILNNAITSSQLSTSLNTVIGLITAPASTAGSVAAQVLTETNNRISAIATEVINRDLAIGVEATNRATAITALSAVKSRTFYSATAPVSDVNYTLQTNDIWYNTASNNSPYRYNGAAWVSVADTRIAQTITDLSTETTNRTTADTAEVNARTSLYAAVNANTGNDYKVFNQSATPTATQIGDIWSWIDGAGTVTFKRWNGTSWVDSTANQRAAVNRGSYANLAGLPTAANVIGDLSRAIDTNLVYVWDGGNWVLKSTVPSIASAFITQESSARAAADTAVASTVTTLSTQMTGGYTGTDPNAVTSGIIYNERLARTTADTAEAYARDSLRAGVSSTGGTEYTCFSQATTPTATQIGDIWSWTDSVGTVTFMRWNGTSWVDSSANKRAAVYKGAFTTLPTTSLVIGDTARLTTTNTVSVWNGTAWVAKTSVSTSTALIDQESSARASADTVVANSVTTLSAQMTGGYTGSDPNLALSGSIIYNEKTARATADTAEASARDALTAAVSGVVGTDYTVYNQSVAPVNSSQIGDIWSWKDATGAITFMRWNGTSWVDSTANKRAAVYRGSFSNFASLPLLGNVIGDTAKQGDTQDVNVWNGTTWVQKNVLQSVSQAFIEQEKSVRANAITAEAQLRTSLATQLTGGYTGTDITQVTSTSLFLSEIQARSAADSSQVSRIQALELGFTSGRSALNETWNGYQPLNKWEIVNGNAATELSIVQVTDAQSGYILRVGNNAGNDEVWLAHRDLITMASDQLYKVTIKVRRTAGGGIFYAGLIGVTSDGLTFSNTVGANTVGSSYYGQLAGIIPNTTESTYYSYFKRGFGANSTGTGTKTDPVLTTAGVRYVRPLIISNYSGQSGIFEYTQVLVESISVDAQATDSDVSTLKITVNDGTTGVIATANRVSTLSTSVNFPTTLNNATYAELKNNYSTTSQMNSAISSSISTVSARLNVGGDIYGSIVTVDTKASSKTANFVQSTPPVSTGTYTLKINDTWVDTGNGRVLKYWDGTVWQLADDSRIGQTASQITTMQSSIQTTSQFDSYIAWEFQNTDEQFQYINWLPTLGVESITITSMTSSASLIKTGLSFTGSSYDKVRMRIKRISGTSWVGSCFYSTQSHPILGNFVKTVTTAPDPGGAWTIIEWDMENLTAGGTDWISNTITSIRFDLVSVSGDVFAIDWIAIGKRGVGAGYTTMQQEISTRATQAGYFASQYSVRAQTTSGGRTIMAGFGLMGTSSPTQGPTYDFGVQADKFWVGATSSSPGVPDSRPFVVVTTDFTDTGTGQLITKGVYMDSAFIINLTALWARFGSVVATTIQATNISASQITLGTGIVGSTLRSSNYVAGVSGWALNPNGVAQLPSAFILGQITASQINSNGLSIKDTAGNVILSAAVGGTAQVSLSPQYITADPNWVNSNIVVGGSNLVTNSTVFTSPTWYIDNAVVGSQGLSDAYGGTLGTRLTLSSIGSSNSNRYDLYRIVTGLLPGQTYIASIWVYIETAGNFVLTVNNSVAWNTGQSTVVTGTGWKRVTATITTSTGSVNINLGSHLNASTQQLPGNVIVSHLKFELGNKETQWTPANSEISNSNISIVGSAIQGIGTGSGTSVANNEDSIVRAPGGGFYTTTVATVTGAIKIRLPVFFTNTMLRLTVDVLQYIGSNAATITFSISGYNYNATNSWINVSAVTSGFTTTEYTVRFGHDGTYCCIWIGDNTTSWSYPQVRVKDVFLGYSNVSQAQWGTGWNISFDTAIPVGNITNSVGQTLPASAWNNTARVPTNLGALTGTEPIQNTQIAIQDVGGVISLTGGPTGSVTAVTPNNKINTGNVSTYIAAGAIDNAYIGNFIQSTNFNGAINASGVITNIGTAGWAIGKAGGAVFDAANIRGQLTTSQLQVGAVTSSSITGVYSATVWPLGPAQGFVTGTMQGPALTTTGGPVFMAFTGQQYMFVSNPALAHYRTTCYLSLVNVATGVVWDSVGGNNTGDFLMQLPAGYSTTFGIQANVSGAISSPPAGTYRVDATFTVYCFNLTNGATLANITRMDAYGNYYAFELKV